MPISFTRFRLADSAPMLAQVIFLLAVTLGMVSGGLWGGLGIGGSILLAILAGWRASRFPVPSAPCLFFVLSALAVIAFSCWDAFDAHRATHGFWKMASIFLPLLFLSSPVVLAALDDPRSFPMVRLSFFLGAGLLVLDAMVLEKIITDPYGREFLISKLNRGFSYGSLIVWPLLAGLTGAFEEKKNRHRALGFLAACFVATMGFTNSRATLVALGFGGGLFFLYKLWPTFVYWIVRIGVCASLAWPFAAMRLFLLDRTSPLPLPDSWRARLEIWDYMAYRIAERPWKGYGIANTSSLEWFAPHGDLYQFTMRPAAHPHNAVVQFWAELGVPGLILFLLLTLGVLAHLSKLSERLRPYAYGAFGVGFWLFMVAYNAWTDSLWAAFALTALAFFLVNRREIKASLRAEAPR